ncbi:aminotransferase class I/II [Candidatus Pacearchaeota archaeon CG_4_9_14_3_um_filter_31_7]|nr:MAG: aminotransferase class I/II [Candidatus Pacearchaeota archaeon CG1_02_31_27]PIN92467.1 MAG: aminotransferase class I/II [Candidatus Pacearchaeota archaeon CG10_big_fil_rev_8_21_14_0_10_31_59]PIZ80967.1 MAG: aminotransferase class I/II [Candidatus Pacearchaeota archaeon CG_4_10_14_0_2_um_filter_31_10]PJA70474.1 MAG: aminotransferase class I/II [Candidatus Pacearchaeota archaeon CG_4_9_14_3_um_filter_31_7]
MEAVISEHFKKRLPSPIRLAQIEFLKRKDKVKDINVAIGNVSLPMHPLMKKRMKNFSKNSLFKKGVVEYSITKGLEETNQAFLNIIASSGFDVKNLYSQITDGGSFAMELVILGTCGSGSTEKKPLLLIDPAYPNYKSFAERLRVKTISIKRKLEENGKFSLPKISEIEDVIKREKPAALVVIPYDNPTGQFFNQEILNELAKLCVKYNLWMISDEAYRELYYGNEKISSVWGITNEKVPRIEGRRISIETSSKVWNACGLRIGALITDNKEFHEKSVAESTASLCANIIGQYIFGSLANESPKKLRKWYKKQSKYYKKMITKIRDELVKSLPGIIVSLPEASIYSVIDVRNIVKKDFSAKDFVLYCASKGKIKYRGEEYTLLVAPMEGFYSVKNSEENPGRTQMRIAYIENFNKMTFVPFLFAELLKKYEEERKNGL